MVDDVTFEILRHRLWAINVEAALALQRVSGSPLATEALDMNTSIMTARGEVVFVGPYLLTGSMSQGMIARYVLAEYADNPSIQPGDVFLCNDPYVGASHQNCVTLVGPIHHGEDLIGWCGATLHLVDVGGAQSGQVGIGAGSIFEEAPPIPPLKIVDRGRLLRDVEAEYLRRSRTAELNALDLRGKIAAINTTRERVRETVERYGVQAVVDTLARTIEGASAHLRGVLAELPDGVQEHTAFVDQYEANGPGFYAVRLRLEKRQDRLRLDFRGSSPQAGAVINCTESGLRSGAMIAVLVYLVDEGLWCPAAVERTVEIVSEPGSVVNARWPAGCSMATMAAGYAVTTASGVCLGKLLAASEAYRDRAMASWAGAVGSVDVFGTDQFGGPFGTVLLDSMASGTGARRWADGIDSGGFLRSIGCVVANVEQYEARYPLMYLYRRQEPDTGGPGRTRGGAGVGYAVVPHKVDAIRSLIPHFGGTQQPESVGLAGGYPGATNQALVLRASMLRQQFAAGRVPTSVTELQGALTPLPGVAQLNLGTDDVFAVVTTGGGGWGDPLDRDPYAVAQDVRSSLVSLEAAHELYGVELAPDGHPDLAATAAARERLLRARARAGRESPGVDAALVCPGCGFESNTPFVAERPLRTAGPHVCRYAEHPAFVLRERYCPTCWRLLAVESVPAS